MTYPVYFRTHVLKVQSQEGLTMEQTACRFKIGIASLKRWHKNLHPRNNAPRPNARKVDLEKLQKDVEDFPDAYLIERAERFGVSKSSIGENLRKLKLTYKKNSGAS